MRISAGFIMRDRSGIGMTVTMIGKIDGNIIGKIKGKNCGLM